MSDPRLSEVGKLLPVLVGVFPLFMVGMWLLVSTLLAWICGHRALLVRYPPVDEPMDELFGWASGRMRGVDFRNALYVGLGPRGLHLAPNGLFRPPFLRGIPCIPWQEVRCTQAQEPGLLGWFWGSRFEIPSLGLRFNVRGPAGRALAQRLGAF